MQRLGQILELGRVEPTGTIAVFRATAVDVVYHDLPLHSRADDLAGRFGIVIALQSNSTPKDCSIMSQGKPL